MKYKKFVAKDMNEAIKQISDELGKDAVIVERRYVKQPGFLGTFRPKIVEIIAGIEQNANKQAVMNGGAVRRMPNTSSTVNRLPQMGQHPQGACGPQMYPQNQPQMMGNSQMMMTPEMMTGYQAPQQMANMPMYQPQMQSQGQAHVQQTKQAPMMEQQLNTSVSQAPVAESTVKPTIEATKPALEKAAVKQETVKPISTYSKFPPKTQVESLKTMMASTEEATTADASKMDSLEDEMKAIRQLLTNMSNQTNVNGKASEGVTYDDQFQTLFGEYDFSKKIQQGFKAQLIKEGIEPKDVSLAHLKNFVEQEIQRVVKIGSMESTSPIHVFVGPPGVGKTTTIAKVASNEKLKNGRKVGMITVDTYRIGAVEQLKTYAQLLDTPIEVVYSPEEMLAAVAKLQEAGCDMIIVDSIGRSHRDQGNLEDLNKLINPLETKNVYLVLNMSTKHRELLKIMDNFKFMNYNQFIFTKLDESERNENILNICYEKSYPVAFLCTGQEVPLDIEEPTHERLMEFVWGGALNE